MKLELPEAKLNFVQELLANLPFIQVKEVATSKSQSYREFEEAVFELNKIKQGKGNTRDVQQLLNELED